MMRELHYAGESVVVSYDMCDAIFHYARALANARLSDIVRIPILHHGKREFSNMLLGPTSLLFCTPAPDSAIDLEDPELLSYMARRGRELSTNAPTRVARTTVGSASADASSWGSLDHL